MNETYEEVLARSGITEGEARLWQAMAAVPEDIFDEYVAGCTPRGEEITEVGLLAYAVKRMAGDE